MTESELKALVSLLDDDDERVLKEIQNKILSLGTEVIPFLEKEWDTNERENTQGRIEEILHTLQFDLLKERLNTWVKTEERDLLEGMWLIATFQYPGLRLGTIKKDLEQLYYDVWMEMRSEMAPFDQVKILNSVFFNKLKFKGNSKSFHAPDNSFINRILESKMSNPIGLCVVYMLIAQKLKMPIKGVNLPRIFILLAQYDNFPDFYINVYNRGLIITKEDIDHYLNELTIASSERYYVPCSNLEIVKRVLRNLIMAFDSREEHQKAEEIKILLELLV